MGWRNPPVGMINENNQRVQIRKEYGKDFCGTSGDFTRVNYNSRKRFSYINKETTAATRSSILTEALIFRESHYTVRCGQVQPRFTKTAD
jgi:hypothetical protein